MGRLGHVPNRSGQKVTSRFCPIPSLLSTFWVNSDPSTLARWAFLTFLTKVIKLAKVKKVVILAVLSPLRGLP